LSLSCFIRQLSSPVIILINWSQLLLLLCLFIIWFNSGLLCIRSFSLRLLCRILNDFCDIKLISGSSIYYLPADAIVIVLGCWLQNCVKHEWCRKPYMQEIESSYTLERMKHTLLVFRKSGESWTWWWWWWLWVCRKQ